MIGVRPAAARAPGREGAAARRRAPRAVGTVPLQVSRVVQIDARRLPLSRRARAEVGARLAASRAPRFVQSGRAGCVHLTRSHPRVSTGLSRWGGRGIGRIIAATLPRRMARDRFREPRHTTPGAPVPRAVGPTEVAASPPVKDGMGPACAHRVAAGRRLDVPPALRLASRPLRRTAKHTVASVG